MDIPDPARTILLSDKAYTFRDEIDNYTQIDFARAVVLQMNRKFVLSPILAKEDRPIGL